MGNNELKRISKLMSYVLRHHPEDIGATLDKNGWLKINVLIDGINRKGVTFDRPMLDEIVATNSKKRFVITDDGLMIRANQGHSVKVDLQMAEVEPPAFLYHGTVSKFMDAITQKGLCKMNRQHVHLSEDKATAAEVGSRRGKPIVLTIHAREMFESNHKFYRSKNGVWLTDHVPSEYIID